MPTYNSSGSPVAVAPVPIYPVAFSGYAPTKANPNPAAMNRAKMNEIYARYRREIDQAVSLTNVPRELIQSIIFTESGGVPNLSVPPVSATGLMQITPATADGMLFIEKSKGRLSAQETAICQRVLGSRIKGILDQKYLMHKIPANRNTGRTVTVADLKNPEFNILIGAITLGLLIDEFTENGVVRLDKVHLRYNQGWFYKVAPGSAEAVLAQAKKRGTEAYNNLLKHLGVNGTLHCLLSA